MNLRELAYGSEKARKLFHEMMTKAGNEVGFHAENMPIMIEAIPMSSDSIQLVITKVSDPEELDTRFSRFSQNPAAGRQMAEDWLTRLTNELLEGAGSLAEQIQKQSGGNLQISIRPSKGEDGRGKGGRQEDTRPAYVAYDFRTLEEVVQAAKAAAGFPGESRMYRRAGEKSYVLIVFSKNTSVEDFAAVCNVLSEYGRKLRTGAASLAYYEEHYKLITGINAIQKLAQV